MGIHAGLSEHDHGKYAAMSLAAMILSPLCAGQ
jgi:hypothetical protein